MLVGILFLFLKQRVMISPPAVASVGSGWCKSHFSWRKLGITMGRSQRIAEELCCVESLARGMGRAYSCQRSVRQFRVRLGVVSQIVMGMSMAGKRSVGGTPLFQRASPSCWTRASVPSGIFSCTTTAPRTLCFPTHCVSPPSIAVP